MNSIFKYNVNAKYSTKDLRGGHNSNNFLLLYVYLDEKIQLPNIFKDHLIVAKASPTMNGCYPLLFGPNFLMVMVNISLN